ncbi:MAG: hypothetical protein HC914_12340 [Chloroflexaceae bacterium]|nr:hypothetical protein [Chloroflexaceae bacterium]
MLLVGGASALLMLALALPATVRGFGSLFTWAVLALLRRCWVSAAAALCYRLRGHWRCCSAIAQCGPAGRLAA